jgi:hypothetical protein
MPKTIPNRIVEEVARAAGASVQVMWVMNGPKDTQIAYIECLLINRNVVLVETFKDGGWDAFTNAATNDRDETVADVLNRCKVPVTPKWAIMKDGEQIGFIRCPTLEDAIDIMTRKHGAGRYSGITVA